MSWKKRGGKSVIIPKGRCAPDYGDRSENFTIVLHHHGKFNNNRTRYNGGTVDYFDFCCVDEMSMLEVKDMASLCGILGNDVTYYLSKVGRKSCKDLMIMKTDTDACNMSLYLDDSDCVGVFVELRTGDREEVSEGLEEEVVTVNEEPENNIEGGTENEEFRGEGEDVERECEQNEEEESEEFEETITQLDNDELDKLFASLRDDKDKYAPDDEQSIGSDSVNSDRDRLVDSDCDISNEDPEFYRNVQVDTNMGGLYTTTEMRNPTVVLPPRKTRSSTTKHKLYDGFRVFNPETEMEDPKFEHGMLFEGPEMFRAAVKQHSIKQGKQLKYGHNERKRIGLTCEAEGCPWKIYDASYKNHGPHTLQIRSLIDEHRCSRVNKIRAANATWMAEEYSDFIQSIKKWNVKSMQAITWKKNNLKMSKYQMYRARTKVESMVNGTVDEQYAMLYNYAAEIRMSDPTNTVKIVPLRRDDGQELFKRIYICWGAMKLGFGEGLRKFIQLDGCHLKTKNGGILLTAIGIDPNNSMYPIAYAIVEKEKTDTWKWFLEYLQEDLNITNEGEDWTFMSDKQKGLIIAVENLFGKSEHRFCVVHLYKNFKLSHSGLALQLLVWKAAKSTRPTDFQKTLNEIKEKDVKAAGWLASRPAANWSKSYFRTSAKTDLCVNNMLESFNGLIKDSRSKPIIEFLEDLRVLLMKKVWANHQQMAKWWGILCPNIAEKFEMQSFKSSSLKCLFNGEDEFEVEYLTGGPDSWQVHLTNRTCSCRKWQLTGIPCAHVICCLKYLGRDEAEYVDPCYTKTMYMKVYSHCLHVIRGRNEWPETNRKLLPPKPEKMPGRPKKYHRKKSAQEIQDQKARMAIEKAKQTGNLGRQGMIMTCKYCNTPGHNRKGCLKRKADEAAKEADAAIGVKRASNVVANTQEAIHTAVKKLPVKRALVLQTNEGGASSTQEQTVVSVETGENPGPKKKSKSNKK